MAPSVVGPALPFHASSSSSSPGPSGELQHTLRGHTGAVLAVKFTKNGRYVMSAGQDKTLRLWNPQSGAHVKTYVGPHNHEVSDVVIAEDNAKFISCGGDRDIFQWDVTTAHVIRKFVGHDRKVHSLAFGPGQGVLVSGSSDKTVRLWDLRARAKGAIQTLKDATDSVLFVEAEGDEVVAGGTDGCLRRYDVRLGQLVVDQLLQPIGSVSFSRDRECVLVSTLDHRVQLLECDTGNQLACYKGHANQRFKVRSVFDPSDAYVVSGSEDHQVCIWDLLEAKMCASLKGHGAPVLGLEFFEDRLVTAAADGEIKVWNARFAPARVGLSALGGALAADAAGLPGSFGRQKRAASAGAPPDPGPGEAPAPPAPPRTGPAGTEAPEAPRVPSVRLGSAAGLPPGGAAGEVAGEGVGFDSQVPGALPDEAEPAGAGKRRRGDRGRKTKRKEQAA